MMIKKEYTDQENKISEILTEMGLRFSQQVSIGPYQVDFEVYGAKEYIVIEADGIYGHSKKADKKRNIVLAKMGMQVYHIKETSKEQIKERLELIFCPDLQA